MDAIGLGYRCVQFHRHQTNQNYSCQMLKDSCIKTFGNVTSEHLSQAIGYDVSSINAWITTNKSDLQDLEMTRPKGLNIMQCVKLGGKIVKMHDTSKGRACVWLETMDGTVHCFSGVAKEKVENLVQK